jgi:hypothetical protein
MQLSIAITGLFALAGVLGAEAAQAQPARIVILRHGEKKDSEKLCTVGKLRAQALSDQYLGKGAGQGQAIFGASGQPAAFFAITPHTVETATPSAESWGQKPVVFDSSDLDASTKKAAATLNGSAYDGKIVAVVWEHHHIADKDLNGKGVTLWSLLGLGKIPNANVPDNWEGVNYDYIWIVDTTTSPPTFQAIKQKYTAAAYAAVPDNDWGKAVDEKKFPEFYKDCKHQKDD